jgi:hypothetical protein
VTKSVIQSVRLQGFQAHTDSTLTLSNGVNVILGDTDVGKSAIVRALGWVVFNRPSGESFVNKEAPICEVEITSTKGIVARSRKPTNSYIVNGNVYTAIGRTVPEDLPAVLNLNDLNFQRQLEPYFLVSETPGNISKFISEILGLAIVDKAITLAKSRSDALRKQTEKIETDIIDRTEAARRLEPALLLEEQTRYASQISTQVEALSLSRMKLQNTLHTIELEEAAIIEKNQLVAKLTPIAGVYDEWCTIQDTRQDLSTLWAARVKLYSLITSQRTLSTTIQRATQIRVYIDLPHLMEQWTILTDLRNTLHALQARMSLITGEKSVLDGVVRVAQLGRTSIEGEVTKYQEILESLSVCPFCKKPMTEDTRNHILESECYVTG